MKTLRHSFSYTWLSFMCLSVGASACVATLAAQPPSQKPGEAKDPKQAKQAPAIVIADEPRAIHPDTLLPKTVTTKHTVSFAEQGLGDVIAWLRREAKLTVIVDERSLSDADILPSEPVADQLNDEPLYLLLDRLSSVSIHWWLDGNGILHLAAADEEHAAVFTRQYNVGDLFDASYDAEVLQDTITSTIADSTWEEVGGSGSILVLGDVLFVRQTNRVHRQVAGLLSALRKHGRRTLIDDPAVNQKIRDAMTRTVTVDIRQTPLSAVVNQLAKDTKIDLRLDQTALRDAGIRERTPVSLNIQDQTLTVTLDLLASQYDLDWMIRDGVLWVTTPDEVEEGVTAVFDVRDLCRNGDESDGLQWAVTSQASPAHWQEVGGSGVISFPIPGTMVVHQTERRLDAVLKLLENYRAALRVSKPRVRADSDPKAVITRYYRLPSDIAKDLMTAMPELLRPETWSSKEDPKAPGSIRMLTSSVELQRDDKTSATIATIPHAVLIIRQFREVHDEIPHLLHRVQNGDVIGGMGGGMGGMGGGGFGGGFFSIPSRQPPRR